MNILLKPFDRAAWANDRACGYRRNGFVRAERTEAVRFVRAPAGADHTWLLRFQGRIPVHAMWPELSLDTAANVAAESIAELREIAATDPASLEREVIYRKTTGNEFRSTVSDVLSQLVMHGSYHRGQIARVTCEGGGTPAATDYITFLR